MFKPPKNVLDGDQLYRADALNVLITSEVARRGVCSDQRKSVDDYYIVGIRQIIQSNVVEGSIVNELEVNRGIESISWRLVYSDITIDKPKIAQADATLNVEPLLPIQASIRNLTYSGGLYGSIKGVCTAHLYDGTKRHKQCDVHRYFGDIPIAVGSSQCTTHGMSTESLLRVGEDPSAFGGEFIIKGVSYNIDSTESTTYNTAKRYLNKGFKNEVVRHEIISKPGDGHENSAQSFIKFLTGGQIVIIVDRDPLSGIQIPFYLVFRLFGWETDAHLFNNMMIDDDPRVNQHILYAINNAYKYKYKQYPNAVSTYDTVEIAKLIITTSRSFERQYKPEDENSVKNSIAYLMSSLDKYLLPHIGVGAEFRNEKLRNLCHYMHQMFYVELNIIKETDRDSASYKRIHAVGTALSKTTKTRWNITVNRPISVAIENDLKKTPFDKLDLNRLIKSISLKDLEKGLTQPIVKANKSEITIGKTVITNRMSAGQLHRKSRIGIYATKNQINNPSDKTQKQSSRAFKMRDVHATNDGIICPCQTQEGESAGLNKQIAIGAHISMATSSTVLKLKVMECKMIKPFDDISPRDIRKGYTPVLVNGHIIGYTQHPQHIVDTYRTRRRLEEISRNTSVFMDPITHYVNFYCDLGRLLQMLIIVKNNRGNTHLQPTKEELDQPFVQWIGITLDDIARMGRSDPNIIDDLVKNGIVEFIDPAEQETLYVAASYDELWEDRHNEMKSFTHCRVPAAMLGLPTLLAAFPTCNQPVRIAYHTNHTRQAMGIPDMNWPFRYDTEYFYQPCNESPLARTIAYDIIDSPGGMNLNVMIGSFTGKNQEDSIVMNLGSIERGRFPGVFFTNMTAEFEFGDKSGKPDPLTTNISPHVNYETIGDDGVPLIGTRLTKGDAVIGRYRDTVSENKDERRYIDKTMVYSRIEDGIVVGVFPPDLKYGVRNQDGHRIIRVKIAIIRTITIGDKQCALPSQEVMTNYGWQRMDNLQKLPDLCVATLCEDKQTLAYVKPDRLIELDYCGPMYHLNSPYVKTIVTPNHNLFVSTNTNDEYCLYEAQSMYGKHKQFKQHAVNTKYGLKDFHTIIDGNEYTVDMFEWLPILGRFMVDSDAKCSLPIPLHKELQYENVPPYVWELSMSQCQTLLTAMDIGHGIATKNVTFANQISRLVFHAGLIPFVTHNVSTWMCTARSNYTYYPVYTGGEYEKYKHYNGKIYCLTIPDGYTPVYYARENILQVPHWTGNSSRNGQKGVVSAIVRDSEMPYNARGVKPDIIINPHSQPSRMTIAQIIESCVSKLCAILGITIDCTAFKSVDTQDIKKALEYLGFNGDGTEVFYNPYNGRQIKTPMFVGPVYYQRIQKFWNNNYRVANGGSVDLISRHISDSGDRRGLRLGEMEKDCIMSIGMSSVWGEKAYDHSHGFTTYYCRRCQSPALVNHGNQITKAFYKCTTCHDKAEIVEIPSSWSSKLVRQGMNVCGTGMKYNFTPFEFPVHLPPNSKEIDVNDELPDMIEEDEGDDIETEIDVDE